LSIRSEYQVQFLSKWYGKINEFGTVLKHCNYSDNGSRVIWDNCLIVLSPQVNSSSVSNQTKAKMMNWAQEVAIDFLNSVFNSNIDNRQSICSQKQIPPSLQESKDGDGALLLWVSILGDDEHFLRLLYLPPG
jgi:hypothetical protein